MKVMDRMSFYNLDMQGARRKLRNFRPTTDALPPQITQFRALDIAR